MIVDRYAKFCLMNIRKRKQSTSEIDMGYIMVLEVCVFVEYMQIQMYELLSMLKFLSNKNFNKVILNIYCYDIFLLCNS